MGCLNVGLLYLGLHNQLMKKFGTRNRVITKGNDPFIDMMIIFKDKYADKIDEIFRKHKIFKNADTITLYGEFYGPNSFGGFHNWDEKHDIYFFDAFIYKKNFLSPSEFYSEFHSVNMPKLIYKGPFESQLIKDVEQNKFSLREGVVYKFVENGRITMGKIKTFDWLEKVKLNFGPAKMLEY